MNVKGSKWSEYKVRRRRAVRSLIATTNRLERTALFDHEIKEVEDLKDALNFVQSQDFNKLANHVKCPICGSDDITYADADNVCFYGYNDEERGKIENLGISHCDNCGFYSIEGW